MNLSKALSTKGTKGTKSTKSTKSTKNHNYLVIKSNGTQMPKVGASRRRGSL